MKALLVRLSSRKFLVAVAGIATAVANKQYTAAAAIVLGYIGVQGVIDHKAA